MDLKTKGTELEGMNSSPDSVSNKIKKSCIHCHTTTTPLWRGGPAGPRSLCNACGIRYRKERRALLGVDKGGIEKGKRKNGKRKLRNSSSKVGVSLKLGLMAMGSLREEEQAAILLMALSCGSFFA